MKLFLHLFLFPCFTLGLLFTPLPVDEVRPADVLSLSATTEQSALIAELPVTGDESAGVGLRVIDKGRPGVPLRPAVLVGRDQVAEETRGRPTTHTVSR